jgi:hypothetical protein
VKALIKSLLPDALIVAGVAALSFGAWLLHPAAGFITGGLLAVLFGQIASMKDSK